MSADQVEVAAFLDAQRAAQVSLLPQFGAEKVLSFMATSGSPGAPPAVAVRRLGRVAPDPERQELVVDVAGALPRPPARSERIAVAIADVPAFRGFQVKSHTLIDPAFAARLHGESSAGARVRAPQVFTIHHGPQAADFFEKIPFVEVEAVARRAPFALLAVGVEANLSPRWIPHHELRDGALELFQGDALWSKTYLNVRRNPREVRLIVDPTTGVGFAVEGELRELGSGEHPEAAARIRACFAGAGLKPPARLTRLRVDSAWRIAPASA